jgi:hypothetical protein
MDFCSNCGTVIDDGISVCPKCGVSVTAGSNARPFPEISQENSQYDIDAFGNAVPVKNKKGRAVASLVLGIIGLLAWIIPLFGFPVTIVGLVMGVTGQKSSSKGMAIAGMVLSIIGLVATTVNAILGAYLEITGQLF